MNEIARTTDPSDREKPDANARPTSTADEVVRKVIAVNIACVIVIPLLVLAFNLVT